MKQETSTRCGRWLCDGAGSYGGARCGLPYGHEGDHVGFHGTVDTPTDTQRVDRMRAVYDEDDSAPTPCAEPLCALLAGHGEPHVDLEDREWRGTEDINALVAELTSVLASPGLPQHAVRALNHADELFGRIDTLLRRGHALPTAWRDRRGSTVPGCLDMDLVYDVTSEAIRTTGGPPECWKALKAASSSWEMLTRALLDGAPLPGPWER